MRQRWRSRDTDVALARRQRIVFGQPNGFDGFRCHADVPIAHAASTLAVGDLDGDGRRDVAFSDGATWRSATARRRPCSRSRDRGSRARSALDTMSG